mgnify:FL=1
MSLTELNAISPIDGRYRAKTKIFSAFFSEEALIKYRLEVEIEYFIALCELKLPELIDFDPSNFKKLRNLYENFSTDYAVEIKQIEKITNHDIKALEYFIKKQFDKFKIGHYKEFIHFGLTSQDINNTAIPLSVKKGIEKVYLPMLEKILNKLKYLVQEYKEIPILSRTHGQPASPSILGKEIQVFVSRIEEQKIMLSNVPYGAKFSGATGNFNAHHVAYPKIDWKSFGERFVELKLGLKYSYPTTQIEYYDSFAALCDSTKRINNIIIDLNRDMWQYISMDYFKQKINNNEIGSSAMPHKINPIDFENSEGNLGMANAVFEFLSSKLPISRLQRDLSDSTVLRNIGVPFGHTLIGFLSTLKGLEKLVVNTNKLNEDLNENWIVVAEAIQTILRKEGFKNPYEALKELTRSNTKVDQQEIQKFIEELNIDEQVKSKLKSITPFNYTGLKL